MSALRYHNEPLEGFIWDFDDFKEKLLDAVVTVGAPRETPISFQLDNGYLRFLEVHFLSQGQFNQILEVLRKHYPRGVN